MNHPVVPRPHTDLALAVYLEPLARDRRVLLLGDAEGPLADRLYEGVRTLEVIDPASREPSRGPVPELPFDDEVFDLVLVCDVSSLPDPRPDAVRELRRVLTRDGLLVLCTHAYGKKRRRSGPPQVTLDKLLSSQFRYVSLLSEAPLAGYSLSRLDASRDDEFAVDSSLVRGQPERAERYVALGSDVRLGLEPRLWVQVPAAEPELEAEPDRRETSSELFRRLEDEAREAAQREADAVRELDAERRARAEAEHRAERARGLERRLRDAEADYDDAVARLRFLESELAEREASVKVERTRRENIEQELAQGRALVLGAEARVRSVEAERDAARADAQALTEEASEVEKRLVERAARVTELEQTTKQKEKLARDLLEELRRLEQHKSAAVEHDARVAELEAERDRAVQRALDAEVARESAQMRVDELRAQVGLMPARAALDAEIEGTLLGMRLRVRELEQQAAATQSERQEQASLRSELHFMRMERSSLNQRLTDAEAALALERASRTLPADTFTAAPPTAPEAALPTAPEGDRARDEAARGERTGLSLRLAEAEAALLSARALAVELDALLASERQKTQETLERLENKAQAAERQARELERELEEADRFSQAHAEDGERIEALEQELELSRRRLDELEDERRSAEDQLRLARIEAEHAAVEASARIELAQRREGDARTERDSVRAALEEARAMLAQLAAAGSAPEASVATIEAPEAD